MDHLFAVSETTKRFIVNTYRVPAERIDVIYNAVDPAFRRLPPAEREHSRFAEMRPFVFHLSKFSERKNPWTILDAFAELAAEERDLTLVLAGAGWDNEQVRRRLRDSGIETQVVFPGFVEKEEIVALMNLAEVFVFPSYYEGFGMPNLEAMACGCPVVTSRAFAIPEVVGDGALTLERVDDASELASKIREIRTDGALRQTLVERGTARAASFSWDESVQTIVGAYRRLLGEPAGETGDG
jgi:glycosyltransferase involved in cell wall biosynthesis